MQVVLLLGWLGYQREHVVVRCQNGNSLSTSPGLNTADTPHSLPTPGIWCVVAQLRKPLE